MSAFTTLELKTNRRRIKSPSTITHRASYLHQKPQGARVLAAAYPQETGEQGYKTVSESSPLGRLRCHKTSLLQLMPDVSDISLALN